MQNLNSQWQKYDSSREEYIRSLCHRPKETSSLGSVNAVLLHQEISRLNSLLKEKMSECKRLQRELESTKRQGQEHTQTLEHQVGCCNAPRQCLRLCCERKPNGFWFSLPQVFIYAEDFKSERADRERAQGEIADLKEQVCQLRRQLHKQVSPQTAKRLK